MNNHLALLIASDSDGERGNSNAFEQELRSSGLDISTVNAFEAVGRLTGLKRSGREPAVVVIGPEIENALSVARQVRAVWPVGQLLFAPGKAQVEKLRRELRFAPMLGPNWSLVEKENPSLPSMVQKAARSTEKRLRLRTTLDRANIKLKAPKPLDSIEYRRLVVSEHYLATLLEQSQDAILSLDTRNSILYWSSGATTLFKRSAKEMYGVPVKQLPFWSSTLEACLEEIHAGADKVTAETKFSSAQGEMDLEVLFSRVKDGNGSSLGTSLAFRDISLRNKMLAIERKARHEAEQMSRMKDEFLAVLSHELRTPLSAVIGRAQLLLLQHRDEPELHSSLKVIDRNAQLQAKLIDDLLDISAVITGKLQLNKQRVSVRQLVEAAVDSISSTADSKQIRLILVNEAITGVLHGDPHRLQQVLYNLLSNAVKFTPSGGQVEVKTSQNESHVIITVSDNGIGISQDFMPSLFSKFGQEESSYSRSHSGLGLGLSIAKQLVELHGGEIHASSAGRNRGATFTVSIPVQGKLPQGATAVAETTDQPGSQESERLAGSRILVVEDVEDARDLITEILEDQGAEVVSAESGATALNVLRSFRPDVLVSDIAMPGMDGYELLGKIRASGLGSDELPALALTAFASEADRAKALLAGFQMHIPKPLIVNELVKAVSQLIKAGR